MRRRDSDPQTLAANLPDVIIDIDVDPLHNAIFWTSRDQGAIKESDLNGGNVHTLLAGLRSLRSLSRSWLFQSEAR